jgi:hypothetical protein
VTRGRSLSRLLSAPPRRGSRSDHGVSLVEFALILPVLVLLLFGIIDFGTAYNDYQSLRHGAREAGRRGAVAQFGLNQTCGLTLSSPPPSQNMQRLMCLAKARVGLGNDTRIKILFDSGYFPGDGLVICAQRSLRSTSGLLAPFLNNRHLKTKVTYRIEQTSGGPEIPGEEQPPPGGTWTWCTTGSSVP